MKKIIAKLRYKTIVATMKSWQKNNKIALVSMFLLFELLFYFIIFSVITFNENFFSHSINMVVADYIWLLTTQILLVYFWIVIVVGNKKENHNYKVLEFLVVFLYLPYITYLLYNVGITSIFTGITLLSNALVGIALIRKKLVWRSFIFHVALILLVAFFPFYSPPIPTLNLVSAHVPDTAHDLFWIKFYFILSAPKAILGVLVCMNLYSDMRHQLKQAQYSASYDELTKVKNRRFIMNYLFNVAYNKNDAPINPMNSQDISVVIIDLDYFKVINDSYGHLAGDMVLIEIGKRLKHEMIKASWEASRYGGEEFLIVLPEVSHKAAMKVANNIHNSIKIKTIKIVDDACINVTASMGVATLSHDEVMSMRDYYKQNSDKPKKSKSTIKNTELKSSNYEELIIERLISMADEALYDAKRSGRNQIKSAHHYIDENVARAHRERNIIVTDEILDSIELVHE